MTQTSEDEGFWLTLQPSFSRRERADAVSYWFTRQPKVWKKTLVMGLLLYIIANQMKFALGLDFGTESARAVLLDARGGEEAACAEFSYPHGVIVNQKDWALQNPRDWVDAVRHLSRAILKKSKVKPAQIEGIG